LLQSNKYLKKFAYRPASINQPPKADLDTVVVIPAFNEPELLKILTSLEACEFPKKPVEIIVVFNYSENATDEVKQQSNQYYKRAVEFSKSRDLKFTYNIISAFNLPSKIAGVGLARKIGMDEAVFRLGDNLNGLIVCLDADCEVSSNYLVAIQDHFYKNAKTPGASIYYEHPIVDNSELSLGIINYELHLRYYNQFIKYAGHPYAFHTVGSSMAVRSWAYQKQGGMNKRKAGEDFYFLQKIIQLGNFSEIKTTSVYPSPRISDRVPFGTGKAQGDWINNKQDHYYTYNIEAAIVLKSLFDKVKRYGRELNATPIQDIDEVIIEHIGIDQWQLKILEIYKNTTSDEAFIKRFFAWYNLFMVMRFVHFYRDNYSANIPVSEAAVKLLSMLGEESSGDNPKNLLLEFRVLEGAG